MRTLATYRSWSVFKLKYRPKPLLWINYYTKFPCISKTFWQTVSFNFSVYIFILKLVDNS